VDLNHGPSAYETPALNQLSYVGGVESARSIGGASRVSIASELLRAKAADILHSAMRERSRPTAMDRARTAVVWLVMLCAASACVGPGLEPPGDRSEGGGPHRDAGGEPMAGGEEGGSGGGEPTTAPPGGDAGTDDVDGDSGEAAPDASVDEDGGSDPTEVEP
jgi:hypothetical protein